MRLRNLSLACAALILLPSLAAAQVAPAAAGAAAPLTLDAALQYALDHYPAVRAAVEQVNASTAGVNVARAAYLPRLDSVWQSNRATANNIFGQTLPQGVLSAISGPVLPSASGQSVWGSAVGALVSWEPIDFGLRHAGVAGAEAAVASARAGETLTRLNVERAVGTAFLAVAAAQRAAAAARADLDRRDVLWRAVQALVDNQLRPGAEASRADAERAAARIRLIQAQQGVAVAQATLERVLGVAGGAVAIDASGLGDRMPEAEPAPAPATDHPLVQVHQAAVAEARAQVTVLTRTDLPRVYVQSSVSARGSGASVTGQFDGGPGGLGLDRANWAAGIQVVFPNVFDYSALRARKAAAAASLRAEDALYQESLLTVSSERRAASAAVQAARDIAANTPIQLASARQGEAQARARYEAGLTSIIEVADAQNLLAQAEVQDQLARIDVWRALLTEAAAAGDLAPFLKLLHP